MSKQEKDSFALSNFFTFNIEFEPQKEGNFHAISKYFFVKEPYCVKALF
jgi:hypothetical protein